MRGEELKIAFFQNKLEVYENLVDLCLRRPDGFAEAFAYIEQAKSRALMDLLMQPVHVRCCRRLDKANWCARSAI